MKGIQLTDYDLEMNVVRDAYGRIVSGLAVGDILHQNQAIILTIRKGELKEFPSVGAGLPDMLLSHDLTAMRNEIRQQLEMDGQTVSKVVLTERQLVIESRY